MPINRLFWDIETSPNSGYFWSSGYRKTIPHDCIKNERAIITICYKWESEKKVSSLTWDKGDDKKLIEDFNKELNLADEIIAHNGDKFDLRFFKARGLYHGIEPVVGYKSVDTLKLARKHFYFNSNRLDYLGKLLLQEGKLHTSFDLWDSIVHHNCPIAMEKMIKYCKKDVLLLQRVYDKLIEYSQDSTHLGVVEGRDAWSCPKCGSEQVHRYNTRVSAKGVKSYQMHCKVCGRYYFISQTNLNKYIEYKSFEKDAENKKRRNRQTP
tara:strand:+ start:437 stop:1237 length:801 start_codon:yes stop_codon:yes gene_type:complete